jgi:biopolymer transport protein ExbD
MTFRRRREMKRTRIEIIPMIDTMFFLLVFFMLSSLALTKLRGLPVNLPQASTAAKANSLDMTITIDKDQHVFVNKTPTTLEDLAGMLVKTAGGPDVDLSKASVVINADKTVPYGVVIQCIDTARSVGIVHFPLATAPDAKGG